MDNLLQCPFCGGDAAVYSAQFGAEKSPRYRIKCSKCTCDLGWEFFSLDEAVAAWNMRVQQQEG